MIIGSLRARTVFAGRFAQPLNFSAKMEEAILTIEKSVPFAWDDITFL